MMRILTHPNVARAVTASALLAIAASAASPAAAANPNAPITKADVLQAETAWGNGIVHIGDVFSKGGDYKAAAAAFIAKHYAYKDGMVLFKPTKASVDEFREDKDQALSYFVGGGQYRPAG